MYEYLKEVSIATEEEETFVDNMFSDDGNSPDFSKIVQNIISRECGDEVSPSVETENEEECGDEVSPSVETENEEECGDEVITSVFTNLADIMKQPTIHYDFDESEYRYHRNDDDSLQANVNTSPRDNFSTPPANDNETSDFANFSSEDLLKYIATTTCKLLEIANSNKMEITRMRKRQERLERHIYSKKKDHCDTINSCSESLSPAATELQPQFGANEMEALSEITSFLREEQNIQDHDSTSIVVSPIENNICYPQEETVMPLTTVDESDLHFEDFDRHQNDEISMTTTPRNKRTRDDCVQLLKKLLTQEYSKDELASSAFSAGTKKYKGKVISSKALSPARLKKILSMSRRQYPKEYSNLNISKVINEKCRKTRLYMDKLT